MTAPRNWLPRGGYSDDNQKDDQAEVHDIQAQKGRGKAKVTDCGAEIQEQVIPSSRAIGKTASRGPFCAGGLSGALTLRQRQV